MWYYYLKYDQKKLNYKDILSKINDNPEKDYIYQDTINMDVARTFFETDQDKKRIMLKNILISLSEIYPKVGYCQGMNHICLFLLDITGESEEWSDWLGAGEDRLAAIKTWLGYSVLLLFDPPDNATVLKAIQQTVDKFAWMLESKSRLQGFAKTIYPVEYVEED
jgi:hypothetical protein